LRILILEPAFAQTNQRCYTCRVRLAEVLSRMPVSGHRLRAASRCARLRIEKVEYHRHASASRLTATEFATIDRIARAEIVRAFADYDVTINDDRNARHKVAVLSRIKDERLVWGGTYAGESRAIAGFGGSGAVNFGYRGQRSDGVRVRVGIARRHDRRDRPRRRPRCDS
jgi:hypothetical protein